MAGTTVMLGSHNSRFASEIPAMSTSWRCASARAACCAPSTNLSNFVSSGQQSHSVSRGLSLSWGTTVAGCRRRSSIPQNSATAEKRASSVVSEFTDEIIDDRDRGVSTFLSSLKPRIDELERSFPEKFFWSWNVMEMLNRIADLADAQTEFGMKKRTVFYRAEDWARHRSSKRHLRHIMSTFSSRVIISLIPPVTALTLISAAVATYNSMVDLHVFPSFFPLLHSSALPYQLTAPAMALLLVFRTEASYSRFDEGRKTWTKVFACTKDLSRQCLAWAQHPQDSQRRMNLQHYIMAFPVALKCHLVDGSNLFDDLKLLLDKDDLDLVMSSQHRPNCLLQLMTQSLTMLHISDSQRSLMDANISQCNESVSVCERIIRLPIPLSYTRLTSRALVLWHLTLPVILWDDCQWMVIFATFFSSCTLFCIEQVGVLIEEPFPMLSLDKMCSIAHQSVQELVVLQRATDVHLKAKGTKLKPSAVNGRGKFGRVPSYRIPQNSPN